MTDEEFVEILEQIETLFGYDTEEDENSTDKSFEEEHQGWLNDSEDLEDEFEGEEDD